jgi:hypothetical protein
MKVKPLKPVFDNFGQRTGPRRITGTPQASEADRRIGHARRFVAKIRGIVDVTNVTTETQIRLARSRQFGEIGSNQSPAKWLFRAREITGRL